jgi:nucleoside 2-deoxyribosyltransferase
VGDGGKQKEELETNNVDINTDRATIMEMGYFSKKNDLVAQIHKIGYLHKCEHNLTGESRQFSGISCKKLVSSG